jgi:hypothetical protein
VSRKRCLFAYGERRSMAWWAVSRGGCGDTSETRLVALSWILERELDVTRGEHVLSHGEDDQLCV